MHFLRSSLANSIGGADRCRPGVLSNILARRIELGWATTDSMVHRRRMLLPPCAPQKREGQHVACSSRGGCGQVVPGVVEDIAREGRVHLRRRGSRWLFGESKEALGDLLLADIGKLFVVHFRFA